MDQPSQFLEYEELLRHNDILRIMVSPYHPPSNVLAMRFVQTLCMQWSPQLHIPRVMYSGGYKSSIYSTRALTRHATNTSSSVKLFL